MLRMLKAILWPCADRPEHVVGRDRAVLEDTAGRSSCRGCPACAPRGRSCRPGALRSTRNAVNFSPSTLANTVNRSAKPALVMYCLVPVSFQLLPSAESTALRLGGQRVGARARLGERVGGDPLAGGQAWADSCRFCSAVPNSTMRHRADADVGAVADRERARARLAALGDQARAGLVAAEAAVLLGDVVAEQAHLARLLAAARASGPASCPRSRAMRGSTSRRMKSSAVSFIMRCSSESISGVRIVADPVGSSRKPPPGDSVTFAVG